MGWTTRFGIGIGATALVAASLAGCGSDAPKADAGPRTTKKPTGEPVKIFSIVPDGGPAGTANFPEAIVGLQAAVAAVNERGGVDGRPLELSTCQDKQDQNTAAACARQAVAEHPVAVVGTSSRFASAYFPILAAAGIPSVGLVINTPSIEATEPLAYPLTLGSASGPAGAGALFADVLHAKKIVTAHIDVASAAESVKLMDVVLGLRGLQQVKLPLPTSAPDYSSYAAAALRSKPDGIYVAHLTAEADKFTLALRQAGYDGPIVRSATVTPDTSIKTLGPAADDIYVPAQFALNSSTDDPAVKRFIREVDSQNRSAPKTDAMKQPYAAVYLFAEAAKVATTMTPKGIIAALDSGTKFDVPMLPPIQFKSISPSAPFPRYFNSSVTFGVVRGGEIVAADDGRFVDVFGH